jgi:hypothetical protein
VIGTNRARISDLHGFPDAFTLDVVLSPAAATRRADEIRNAERLRIRKG